MFPTHRGFRAQSFRFALLLLLLISVTGTVLAQGGASLANGSVVTGTINDQTKLVTYTYTGNPGEVISAQVIGITPGMNPTVSLLSPTQQQLATNDNDPFSVAGSTNARITYRIKEAGGYSILVGGTNGQFILQFSVRPPAQATSLQIDTPAAANIMAGAAPQTYNFSAVAGTQTVLTLSTNSPNFAFMAQVYDSNGQLVALLGGSTMQAASLTVAPGSDLYEIVLTALSSTMQGNVSLQIAKGSAATAATPEAPTAVPTMVPTTTGVQPPAGVCSATPLENSAINIRSGPSTAYPAVEQLLPNTFLIIQGRNGESTWLVNLDGGTQRWIAVSVVKLYGPCDNLSVVTPPPPPATVVPPTDTATSTPTKKPVTYIVPNLATKTFTATRTPTRRLIVPNLASRTFTATRTPTRRLIVPNLASRTFTATRTPTRRLIVPNLASRTPTKKP